MSTENKDLPSIEDVAAKFNGGTASDPNIPAQGEAPTEPAPEPTPEPEAKVEEPEVKKEPQKDASASRFAALARKERAIREREAAAERRIKEAEERLKAVTEKETSFSQIRKDPLKALKDAGLSYSDITSALVGGYTPPEEDPVDLKIRPVAEKFDKFEANTEALKAELAELKQQLASEQQTKQYQEVMSSIKTAASDEKYEFIQAIGDEALNLVRDTVVEYYKLHNKMLDYSEACDIVEKYYEDDLISKVQNTKKLRSRLNPSPAPTPAPKQPAKKEARESTTLTNKLSAAPEANVDIDKLPKHEALAYLAKKLKFINE